MVLRKLLSYGALLVALSRSVAAFGPSKQRQNTLSALRAGAWGNAPQGDSFFHENQMMNGIFSSSPHRYPNHGHPIPPSDTNPPMPFRGENHHPLDPPSVGNDLPPPHPPSFYNDQSDPSFHPTMQSHFHNMAPNGVGPSFVNNQHPEPAVGGPRGYRMDSGPFRQPQGMHVTHETMASSFWEPTMHPRSHTRMDRTHNHNGSNHRHSRHRPPAYQDPREHSQFVGAPMTEQRNRMQSPPFPQPNAMYAGQRYRSQPPYPQQQQQQQRQQQYDMEQQQQQHWESGSQWQEGADVYQPPFDEESRRGSFHSRERGPGANPHVYGRRSRHSQGPEEQRSPRVRGYTLERDWGEPTENFPPEQPESRARGSGNFPRWGENPRSADNYQPESFTTAPMGPRERKTKKNKSSDFPGPMGPSFDEAPKEVVVDVLPKSPPDSVFSYTVRQPDDQRPPQSRYGHEPSPFDKQEATNMNNPRGWGAHNDFHRNYANGRRHADSPAAGPHNHGAFHGPPPPPPQPPQASRPQKPRTKLWNPNFNADPNLNFDTSLNSKERFRSASFYDPSRDFATGPSPDDSPPSGASRIPQSFRPKVTRPPMGAFFDNDKQNVQPRETVVGPISRTVKTPPKTPVSGASRIFSSFDANSGLLREPVGASFDGGKNEEPRETVVGPKNGSAGFSSPIEVQNTGRAPVQESLSTLSSSYGPKGDQMESQPKDASRVFIATGCESSSTTDAPSSKEAAAVNESPWAPEAAEPAPSTPTNSGSSRKANSMQDFYTRGPPRKQ